MSARYLWPLDRQRVGEPIGHRYVGKGAQYPKPAYKTCVRCGAWIIGLRCEFCMVPM